MLFCYRTDVTYRMSNKSIVIKFQVCPFQGVSPAASPSHSRKASGTQAPKASSSAPQTIANGYVNDASGLDLPLFHSKTTVCHFYSLIAVKKLLRYKICFLYCLLFFFAFYVGHCMGYAISSCAGDVGFRLLVLPRYTVCCSHGLPNGVSILANNYQLIPIYHFAAANHRFSITFILKGVGIESCNILCLFQFILRAMF